jgi:cystathionine beta-lyase
MRIKGVHAMDFSTRIGRLGTNCLKWDSYDPDVIPLWLADMDFQSPEPVRRALMERVDHGIFGYPLSISCEMKQTIVERLYRLYDWKIAPEDIIPLPGVIAGFNLVCQALCPPGKSVLIQTPVYPPIREIAQNAGLFPQEADLIKVDGIFQIDLDRFKNTITPNTGIFILCNPHNPVGRVFTRSELDHLSEICLSHNLYI